MDFSLVSSGVGAETRAARSSDASARQEDSSAAGDSAAVVESLVSEHDEGGIIKYYDRPAARIPMQSLRVRGGDGAWTKSYVIRLLCDRTRRC
jgi:hypothetical protein